jgi:hypothetical protein
LKGKHFFCYIVILWPFMRLPPHEATWFCKICCKSLDPSVGVNISEDARHWMGLLQYNPSTVGLGIVGLYLTCRWLDGLVAEMRADRHGWPPALPAAGTWRKETRQKPTTVYLLSLKHSKMPGSIFRKGKCNTASKFQPSHFDTIFFRTFSKNKSGTISVLCTYF